MQMPAYCTALSLCHYNDPTLAAASLRRGDFSENLDNHVVRLNCRESQGKGNSDGWRLLSRLSLGKIAKLRATETPSQSVRCSIQLIVRDPFERPMCPLRRVSGERSAFDALELELQRLIRVGGRTCAWQQ